MNSQALRLKALVALGVCLLLTGCGSPKPPDTAPPGSEHVAGEKQEEKDVSTVHTSNGSTGNGSTGAQNAGGQ